MENNFICTNTNCKQEFFIPRYSCTVKKIDEEFVNIYKGFQSTSILTCDKCGSNLDFLHRKIDKIEALHFQKFGSLTPLEKQQALKKRSREDAKKQQYVKGYHEMERDEQRKNR